MKFFAFLVLAGVACLLASGAKISGPEETSELPEVVSEERVPATATEPMADLRHGVTREPISPASKDSLRDKFKEKLDKWFHRPNLLSKRD
uniref:AMP n=1 Tax=Tachyglossus aculeatus TaxID=9261 RepID=L7QD51_TACAU|nr:AMP [Tachyglossus aculeatus]